MATATFTDCTCFSKSSTQRSMLHSNAPLAFLALSVIIDFDYLSIKTTTTKKPLMKSTSSVKQSHSSIMVFKLHCMYITWCLVSCSWAWSAPPHQRADINHHVHTKWDVPCASLVKQLKGNYEQGIRGTQNWFKGQKLLERDQSVWTRKKKCYLNKWHTHLWQNYYNCNHNPLNTEKNTGWLTDSKQMQ